MTRWLTTLLLGWMTLGALETKASMAIGSQRFNLRWNGVNRGLPLPFAGRANPIIPVSPWFPSNSITFTTNRVMLPDTLNVLFLGNNIVKANNMASVLTSMSQVGKLKIKAKTYAPGGYSLFNHSVDIQSVTNISTSFPDFRNFTNRIPQHVIVLQEHTRAPVYTPVVTLASAQRLNVRAQASKSQVAFLLPHAMGDGFYSAAEMYRQAERSIYGVAAQLNAPVVPAGLAWQLVEARHPDIRLRDRTGFLPSQHGTYLNACMMYSALTWQSPLGLSNGGLFQVRDREAKILQRTAWEVFVARRGAIPF